MLYKKLGLLEDPVIPAPENLGHQEIKGFRTLASIRAELEQKHRQAAEERAKKELEEAK